jgi:tetratricopeptide (TPR) repeat protein
MSERNFFAELNRRNVYKVAVAYAVVGWLVIQVSSTVLPTFHAPEWVVQTLVVLVAIGFPIALDPNYATAHQWFTTTLAATLQFDRAIAEDKKAVELDPLSLIVNSDLAFNYINAHRFDDAMAQSRKTLEIDPGFHVVRGYLGLALQFKGQLKEALPEFRAVEPFSQGLLGQACARAGLRDEAQTIVAHLEDQAHTRFVTGYSIAVIRLALGDKEGALTAPQTAADQHASEILTLQSDPLFDDLHGDPRFEALIKKIFGSRS